VFWNFGGAGSTLGALEARKADLGSESQRDGWYRDSSA
jgi:hypothetical protein